MRFSLLVAGATLLATTIPCQSDPGTSYVFQVSGFLTPAQHAVLAHEYGAFDCHAPIEPGAAFEVIVEPEQLPHFASIGVKAIFLRRGAPFAGPLDPDPGYYTTAEVIAEIDKQVTANPAICRKVDLATIAGAAKTHYGQSIWALKISDNVGSDEDEPAIVLAAQHHARELNATHMVIGAMGRIVSGYASDPALKTLVDSFEVWCVPCVNPDGNDHVWGVDANWRKNRRNNGSSFGVDPNRNYPFLWTSSCQGSTTASSDTYRGPSAGSEPEVQTMRALIAWLRPEIYLDFHSSGQEVLSLYAPCASVTSQITALSNYYVNDLRTKMSYNTRAPSASGEAPQDHWADSGTMSLLTEIGTSFQPAFATTVAEEARVWPGIKHAATNWRPAVRGHVRSILQNAPILAQISYTPDLFNHTERMQSRARDGRYGMWLPANATYQVTFTATGYNPETRTVTVGAAYNNPITLEIEMTPAGTLPASLVKTGSDRIGTTTTLAYSSPGDAGDTYWVALSGGSVPGIPIGGRTLPLNADGLLFASAVPNSVLLNNLGILPGSATATASLPIPAIPALVGIGIWTGGMTLNDQYNYSVKKFSSATSIVFQP